VLARWSVGLVLLTYLPLVDLSALHVRARRELGVRVKRRAFRYSKDTSTRDRGPSGAGGA
jgi:hypothetical protein